jgi:hypothetical protein
MIRDAMVWLDGGVSDEIRLAAVADMARLLGSKVIIGLFLNALPLPGRIEGDATAALIDQARATARPAGRDQAVRCAGG